MALVIPGGRLLKAGEKATIKTVKNILAEQLETKTLQAAAKEAAGEVVATKATGQAFDHITKVKQGLQGLVNAERQLSRSLRDNSLSAEARATLQRTFRETRQARKRTERFCQQA